MIRLLPGDDPSLYQTVPHALYPATQLMLDHKENGDCIYLGEAGCSIHAIKPQMCREMDCRNIGKLHKKQAERMGILKVWRKGRSMV
jgi:Fe-S-cluster containining protein